MRYVLTNGEGDTGDANSRECAALRRRQLVVGRDPKSVATGPGAAPSSAGTSTPTAASAPADDPAATAVVAEAQAEVKGDYEVSHSHDDLVAIMQRAGVNEEELA